MDYEIAGLPLHPLLVHAVVVLLPLTAVAVVLHAVWPAARRRLGVVTPLAALLVLILVPITTAAGSALADALGRPAFISQHEALGKSLLPWAIGLFVVAAVLWGWYRWGVPRFAGEAGDSGDAGAARTLIIVQVVLIVAALAVAIGSGIMIFRIGDSGARAVWEGVGG